MLVAGATVFAFPVSLVTSPVGAIDLFCRRPGALDAVRLSGAGRAAQLAALPLLDMMTCADVPSLASGCRHAGSWFAAA